MKKKVFAVLTAFMLFACAGCSDENRAAEINELNEKISELNEIIKDLNEIINKTDEIFYDVNDKIENDVEITEADEIIIKINDSESEEPTIEIYAELDNFDETSDYITIQGKQFDKKLKRLTLDGIKMTNDDINKLKYMVNLEYLNIPLFDTDILFGTNTRSDISALAGLTNLTTLHLGFTIMNDISPLAGLKNLTELSMGSWFINDISALAELTKLTELHIPQSSIRDISALTGLTNLKILSLGSENRIRDFSPLLELPYLTSLYIKLRNQLSNIDVFKELTHLTSLSLVTWGVGGGDLPLLTTTQLLELVEALPNTEIK